GGGRRGGGAAGAVEVAAGHRHGGGGGRGRGGGDGAGGGGAPGHAGGAARQAARRRAPPPPPAAAIGQGGRGRARQYERCYRGQQAANKDGTTSGCVSHVRHSIPWSSCSAASRRCCHARWRGRSAQRGCPPRDGRQRRPAHAVPATLRATALPPGTP